MKAGCRVFGLGVATCVLSQPPARLFPHVSTRMPGQCQPCLPRLAPLVMLLTGVLAGNTNGCKTNKGVLMTIQELEKLEDRARSGLTIHPELILSLTAYLRDVLQAKIAAEAVASQALKAASLNSPITPLKRVVRLS